METILLTTGLVCLIAAIVGGGLKAFNIELPGIASVTRQILLGALGLSLLSVSLLPEIFSEDKPNQRTSTTPRSDGCGALADEFETTGLDSWQQLNSGTFSLKDGNVIITAQDGADVRGDLQGGVTAPSCTVTSGVISPLKPQSP